MPKEEAAALEVLVRERGSSTPQVGEAINRSPMYVSNRLRVFEDLVLAAPVLGNQLAGGQHRGGTATRPRGGPRGVCRAGGHRALGQAEARQAVEDRKVTLRTGLPSPRLPSHIRALREELAGLNPSTLSILARRELKLLLEGGRVLTSTATPHRRPAERKSTGRTSAGLRGPR